MKFRYIIYIVLFALNSALAQSNSRKAKAIVTKDWLSQINSQLAKTTSIKPPYLALKKEGNSITLYKSKFVVNADGFAKQMQTFVPVNDVVDSIVNLIVEPIHFHFFITPKKQEKFVASHLEFLSDKADQITWKATNTSENLQMDVKGAIEVNGHVTYQIKVTALNDVSFSNINFHIPMDKVLTKHLLGLGVTAPLRPDTVKYNWKDPKLAKGVWIGDTKAGLYYNLVGENQKMLPDSWENDGKGGIQINIKGSSMLADNFTGAKSFKKGEVIYYNFNLLTLPLIKENQLNK